MFTIDETNEMLNEIVDTLPQPLFRELSGGIIILPQSKVHPKALDNDLYILGEYSRSSIGTLIKIYYGSFVRIYGNVKRDVYYQQLRRVLVHELRHHNETLAGYRDLVLYDERRIAEYLKRKAEQKAAAEKRSENSGKEIVDKAEVDAGNSTEDIKRSTHEQKTPEQWR